MQYPLSFFLSITLLCLTPGCGKSTSKQSPEIVQESVLSNAWYPHDAKTLTAELGNYFALAEKHFAINQDNTSPIQALVVPHASYYASGLCAATAYQSLLKPTAGRFSFGTRKNTNIKRVIILAPNHTIFHQGIALPYCNVYQTALGKIQVDTDAVKQLSKHPPFSIFGEAHLNEHAVEMQLPFLQSTVDSFKIVPLVLGHLAPGQIATAAKALYDLIDDKTLVVASSDLTHYGHTYGFQPFMQNIQLNIRKFDSFVLQALSIPSLVAFNEVMHNTKTNVCGQEPLRVLLTLFETKKFADVQAETTCYYTSAHMAEARNKLSGDINTQALFKVPTDKQSETSVSYAGIVYRKHHPENPPQFSFNDFEKKTLLTSARASIENHFQDQEIPEDLLYPMVTPALEQNPGIFVSLKMPDNHIRGCVGTVKTTLPLYKSVHDLSLSAAFNDKRFLPLLPGELGEVKIEISLLTTPQPIKTPQEIILGKHGIILEKYDHEGKILGSALFLPAVAREFQWTLEETLTELSMKAGLLPNSWRDNTTFAVFEDYEINEPKEPNAQGQ